MEKNILLAIDGGTTNTRLTLVRDGRILGRTKLSVGVRDTAGIGRDGYALAIRKGLDALLCGAGIDESSLCAMAASGMITSASGLCEVSHVASPAGESELCRGAVRMAVPEISDRPILFIPGVKSIPASPDSGRLGSMDIMRGEETEILGLQALTGVQGEWTAVLPGSHMKIVSVDETGRITDFSTSLSGELMRAAAEHTILSQTVAGGYPRRADSAWLMRGFELAGELGINEALFKVRVAGNFLTGTTKEELYSFLMGCVLYGDVMRIRKRSGRILIAGSEPIRGALACLLGGQCEVIADEAAENAAALGAARIARLSMNYQ